MRMNLIAEEGGFAVLNDNAVMRTGARAGIEADFYAHTGRSIDKWHHYLEVYERHLSRFRDRSVRLLEIGVQRGGSLQLWRRYLGSTAIIHGLDVDPTCMTNVDPETNVRVHTGDQADVHLLAAIVEEMGGVDVVIDDGGHQNGAQIASFEYLYPQLAADGVYICEDTHTSYWPEYGGSPSGAGSFIAHAKMLVDLLHGWHTDAVASHAFAAHTKSILFYDSMVVLERARREPPTRSIVP